MSAELETLLNDLIMRSERANADFNREVYNTRKVEEATAIMRRLNAASYEQALSLMQSQSFSRTVDHSPVPPMPVLGQVAWN